MSNLPSAVDKNFAAVEAALVQNDLSKMNVEQRLQFYKAVCDSIGLNYITQPLAYIMLNGKITLYAKRDAADQLRKIHGVSIQILSRETRDGLYIVTVKAKDKTGREDEATGVIPIEGRKGADLANDMLKCETKAKRRVTLSICGLGLLDETELGTIQDVKFADNPQIMESHPLKKQNEAQVLDEPLNDHIENALLENINLGDYVCKFGKKYSGKKLSEIGAHDLDQYLQWLSNSAQEQNKTLTGNALELYETGQAQLNSLETAEMYKEEVK